MLAGLSMDSRSFAVPWTIAIEKRTVSAMVRIYCADRHAAIDPPCDSCAALVRFSHARLDTCPYGAAKPTCRECPIHCYKPAEREAMREVMRFAGRRMVLRHPWLAVVHFWKERFHKTPRRKTGPRQC
jgi:hypothetical protein